LVLPTIDAIAGDYPELGADTIAAGLAATASFPLMAADGTAAGAIGFGWEQEQPFGDEQVRLLDLIAQMSASALERAVLHQQHLDTGRARELAEAQLLQEIFLPRTLPKVEHLEAAAVYLPASDAAMGGDWYDVFPVHGQTCFVIGDVAGHGLQAAAVMVQLRNAARAYAVEHSSPAEVMARLNEMLCQLEPTETASAIVVMWDPTRDEIVRANAGHPPILRCRPGEFGFLHSATSGTLLGVDPSCTYEREVKQLRPGTTLLFYTDGLVEQRGESLTEGMEVLRGFVETLSDLSPQAVCNAVLAWRLGRGRREDDICVLAVRLA
jgi:serine phosphatase RsbU (regulator of sigma subunit)